MTAYDDIEALNWSSLKLMHTSPLLYRYRQTVPREDSAALRLGRAIHCAVLEPERWASAYTVAPDVDLTTRAGKAARARWLLTHATLAGMRAIAMPDFGDQRRKVNQEAKSNWHALVDPNITIIRGDEPAELFMGAEVLNADEHATAEACAAAIAAHTHASAWLRGGRTEQVVTWTDPETGVKCKARLDLSKAGGVVDLKSTRHHTVRQIAADCARYLYHGQLAWYHDGARAAGVLPHGADGPRIVAVSTVPPHDVACFTMGVQGIELGRRLYRKLLSDWLDCQASDWWPGMAPEPMELPLPRWTPDGSEEDEGWE